VVGLLAIAAVLVAVVPVASHGRPGRNQFVLSPEGNHLWAYDAATGQRQLVVRAVNGSDPGIAPHVRSDRRDINGQICVAPDGRHVVTGEDTVLAGAGGDGGSSHDPRIAGWGWFEIGGSRLGRIWMRQAGKLAPAAGSGPGYAGDPDNFGCGFLDAGRLFTTALGNTLPGEDVNGQLFLWFGPFEAGYHQVTSDDGTGFFVGEVPHCEIDKTLATAGGIAVDGNGDVYVTTNRPDADSNAGSVWRYRGTWPRTAAECTPEYIAANITKTQVVPSVDGAPADPRTPTPSSVVISPDGTLYVSSVFSGTVSEFTKDGEWIRDLYPLSPVTPFTGPTGNTPFGMAVTADGSLWIADLGIVLAEPGPGLGSLIRVRFDRARDPVLPAETVQDGLTFPDGLGVYTAPRHG
jgi:hypothetical protein